MKKVKEKELHIQGKWNGLANHCKKCNDYIYQAEDCVHITCYSCHNNICEWCSGLEREELLELKKDNGLEYICEACEEEESACEFVSRKEVEEEIIQIYEKRCEYLEHLLQVFAAVIK